MAVIYRFFSTRFEPNTSGGADLGSTAIRWGTLYAANINISGGFTSSTVLGGTYTPNITNSTNLDSAATATAAQYIRVGSVVTVSGRFTADPTLAATATSFDLSLPVGVTFSVVENLAGVAFCGSIAGQGAEIIGVTATGRARVQWVSGDITSQTWSYTFTFEI